MADKIPHIVAINAIAMCLIKVVGSSPAEAKVEINPITVPMIPIVGA